MLGEDFDRGIAQFASPFVTVAFPWRGVGDGFFGVSHRRTVPPSMLITWPLIHSPSCEMRNATRAAMSSGAPTRGPRMRLSAAVCNSGHCGADWIASVAVKPGATALHRIPSLPHRDATCLVRAPIPALEIA